MHIKQTFDKFTENINNDQENAGTMIILMTILHKLLLIILDWTDVETYGLRME